MALMDDEEFQALVRKVWTDCGDHIKATIERAIYDELSLRGRSQLSRVLHGKLNNLVDKVVEEKEEFIVGAVSELVRKKIETELESLLESHTSYLLREKTSALLKDLKISLERG